MNNLKEYFARFISINDKKIKTNRFFDAHSLKEATKMANDYVKPLMMNFA